MSRSTVILPGSTIGILGGGQLGRMFVTAARTMGYEVIVFDPDKKSPAGSLATQHICASYDDKTALKQLAEACEVITIEFENIPLNSVKTLQQITPVYPDLKALEIAQNRIKEKTFIQDMGFKTAEFVTISCDEDCLSAPVHIFPAILKTAELGYDGKGQVVCNSKAELMMAFKQLNNVSCVLEKKINLLKEVSVIVCRGLDGQSSFFPVAENQHINGILDTSIVPADIPELIAKRAQKQAQKIAERLNYCGVLAVEFFISDQEDLLINEMAPRPHNSGHYTLDACMTSQFEQQVRMVCGLAAGKSKLMTPVVMWNILGDIWPDNDQPDWIFVMNNENSKLHLYGKKQARNSRKMGHINILCKKIKDALDIKQIYVNYFYK